MEGEHGALRRLRAVAAHAGAPACGPAAPAAAEGADRGVLSALSAQGRVCCIQLNRPGKLNALSMDMIRALRRAYDAAAAPGGAVRCIVLKGTGRAFCAGGDVAAVRASALAGGRLAQDFFFEEYALVHLISALAARGISQVTLWDGITMGGGVGLGVHAPFRVVTERTVLAKPETRIGLFPDVGSTHALPRLRGGLPVGLYVGLTGVRLRAADLLWSGLASHYVPAAALGEVERALGELGDRAADPAAVDRLLLAARGAGAPDEAQADLIPNAAAVERCFAQPSVERICAALERETERRDWAQRTLRALREQSPMSLKLTFEALRRHAAPSVSVADALVVEYRLSQRCALRPQPHSDFHEGIRAVLVDKDQPRYSPASLEGVSAAAVESFFAPLEPGHLRGELPLPWP